MELDKEKLKAALTILFESVKELEADLMAHQLVLHSFDLAGVPEMKTALELARNSPPVRTVLDTKYKALLETLRRTIDGVEQDQELSEYLRSWKPQGPIH
jgi:hypothetical protein